MCIVQVHVYVYVLGNTPSKVERACFTRLALSHPGSLVYTQCSLGANQCLHVNMYACTLIYSTCASMHMYSTCTCTCMYMFTFGPPIAIIHARLRKLHLKLAFIDGGRRSNTKFSLCDPRQPITHSVLCILLSFFLL